VNRNTPSALGEAEHRTVDSLLPWYVNATLEMRDRARVEAHLAFCPQCREELELLKDVQLMIAVSDDTAPPASPNSLKDILARIKNQM
jgi:anti-sigma factor RsiW